MDSKANVASADKAIRPSPESDGRRSGRDRRAFADRRRSGGLFEVRARRGAITYDRRRGDRRDQGRSWLAFWRR